MEITLADIMQFNSLEEDCSCQYYDNIERPCPDCNDTYKEPTAEGKQILDFIRRHLEV